MEVNMGLRRIGFATLLSSLMLVGGCFADLNVNYVKTDAAIHDRVEPITRQKIADDLASGKISKDQADDRNTTLDQWGKMINDTGVATVTVTSTVK
jgi:hypothetical protein